MTETPRKTIPTSVDLPEIRLLSLWQPYASLIALNLKQFETRSWSTPYRGKIAIHAAKRLIDEAGLLLAWEVRQMTGLELNPAVFNYPLGAIVAVADLTDCRMMDSKYSTLSESLYAYINEQTPLELAVGDWKPGRYAWKLENIRPIAPPIACKGAQGLRPIQDAEVLEAIASRCGARVAGKPNTAQIEQQMTVLQTGGGKS